MFEWSKYGGITEASLNKWTDIVNEIVKCKWAVGGSEKSRICKQQLAPQ